MADYTSLVDDLPREVRLRIKAQGTAGREWLSALPELIRHLASRWECIPGAVLTGGSESMVLKVKRGDADAIIKIGLPDICNCGHEAQVLTLAGAAPYVDLMAYDEFANALLLEPLGEPLASTPLSTGNQMQVLCETLRQTWIPLGADHKLMTGAEKAAWLADFIDSSWRELQPVLPDAIRDMATAWAREREVAHDDEHSCLVHGDAHEHNTLRDPSHSGRFKFIDPDGLYAEPACDLAVLMRGWNADLLAGDTMALAMARRDLLSSLTGVDATAIWQWGYMERVSTGLLMLQLGMNKEAHDMLNVAEALLQS